MMQANMEPLIDIRELSKSYVMGREKVRVLNEISLQVMPGEFVAIVGPSGSGKSTLMNVIGCLDAPSEGSYKLDGIEVKGLSDNKLANIRNRKIGFIFQSFHLLPKLSAIENVELPLVYRGMSSKERRERSTRALAQVGLSERMFHKPSELSGGQQQRVAIARALAGHPPMLLADEPTGALDTKTGQEVLALIEQLNAEGHTIVLITHDQEVARRASRIVVMRDGCMTEQERRVEHEVVPRLPNGLLQHPVQQA
ncbi:ABC transporter ATP-binding protein [Paenibacillus agaridevorans]|uniref:ABC transporter ATP-binding protein n=1 Tax=Paenibacillus agaridevorans TaxID=171404 RepID=UPI003CCE95C8